MRYKDETGKKYGKLRVQAFCMYTTNYLAMFTCNCDCGGEIIVRGSSLRNGTARSCGCLKAGNNRLPRGESSKRNLLKSYKTSAERRGHCWELTDERFYKLVSQNCAYCGKEPRQSHLVTKLANGDFIYQGLDRKDSGKGYTQANTIPCCKDCNNAKGLRPFRQFMAAVLA